MTPSPAAAPRRPPPAALRRRSRVAECCAWRPCPCSPLLTPVIKSQSHPQVAPDAKFADLGADSLDTVEIMMALEEKFEVTVDEEGAEKISTVQVGDLTRLLVLQYWCCGTQMGAAAISGA